MPCSFSFFIHLDTVDLDNPCRLHTREILPVSMHSFTICFLKTALLLAATANHPYSSLHLMTRISPLELGGLEDRIYWAHMQTSVTTPLRHVRAQCNSPGIPITLCIICPMSMSQQAYQAPHMQNLDNEYSTLQKRRSMSLRSHAIRALVIHNHDYVRSTVGYLSSSLWGHGRFSVNHNQMVTIGCHYRNTNPQLRCHLFDV